MVFHCYFFLFTCVGWYSFLPIHLYYPIFYPSFFIVRGSFKSKMGLCCTKASSILQIPPFSPHDIPTITLLYIWSYVSCFLGDPYTLCVILIPNMSHTMICDKGPGQIGTSSVSAHSNRFYYISKFLSANHQGCLSGTHVKRRMELGLVVIATGIDIC